ncbi:MAG: putative capsular polysaccharide synthesis family protein [Bacteroidetes bacterium]|nr:putative capsular polysaccharide synthesis family protein [Bacteroidota bacterium]
MITAVRDPLAILLSNFYQNEPFFIEGDFRNNGKYDIDKIKNHLIEDLQKGTTLCFFENWFSDEFEKALNIDVFKLEFNQEQGFGVYKFDGMDLMIVQAEKINDLETEFANFLNCENFKLQYDNVRSETEDAESYNKLKSTISFDKEIIDQVYSSRLVQYFYNHSQITGFSKKWNQHNS